MSTATIPVASLKETLLREVNVLSPAYYPKVLHFIETLKETEYLDDLYEIDKDEWLRCNPPIPIEEDPTITPEHLERLRQRFRDVDEGRAKVVTFTPEELEEFWQEMEHSPEEAKAKARSRAHYRTPKQS
jgi:hypothetical protein